MESELENAERARRNGNEGKARVCARRAAGLAARNFLIHHNAGPRDKSAYAALQVLAEFPGLAQDLRTAAIHLITPLTKTFTLPVDADLIADARKLIGELDERYP
ncbi:MAG: hypothetical protein WCE68_15510 [Anaerolineales bacterium]